MMVARPQDVGLSADLHPNHGSRVTARAVVDLILNAHRARTTRRSPGPRDHRSIVSAPPRRTRAVGGSCVPAACPIAQLLTVSGGQPRVILGPTWATARQAAVVSTFASSRSPSAVSPLLGIR